MYSGLIKGSDVDLGVLCALWAQGLSVWNSRVRCRTCSSYQRVKKKAFASLGAQWAPGYSTWNLHGKLGTFIPQKGFYVAPGIRLVHNGLRSDVRGIPVASAALSVMYGLESLGAKRIRSVASGLSAGNVQKKNSLGRIPEMVQDSICCNSHKLGIIQNATFWTPLWSEG